MVAKLKKMFFDGHKRFEYIEHASELTYSWQKRDWHYEFGQDLPDWEDLGEFGKLRDLRVLSKTSIAIVWMDDGRKYWFQFDPGFITDFASVPSVFRSIVDQDDVRLLPAVLVHDFLFSTQKMSFKQANRLFYDMAVKNGYPKWRARLAWMAVSSFVGKIFWKRQGEFRREWSLETAFVTEQTSDNDFKEI